MVLFQARRSACGCLLPVVAIADVIVSFQDRNWVPRSSRRKDIGLLPPPGSVGLRLAQLAFQRPVRSNAARTSSMVWGSRSATVGDCASECLLLRPAVQFLSPSIPVRDGVIDIADENSVMREIEQVGLLGSFRHFPLQFVAGLQKLSLDAAADGADQVRSTDQNEANITGASAIRRRTGEGSGGTNQQGNLLNLTHELIFRPRYPMTPITYLESRGSGIVRLDAKEQALGKTVTTVADDFPSHCMSFAAALLRTGRWEAAAKTKATDPGWW